MDVYFGKNVLEHSKLETKSLEKKKKNKNLRHTFHFFNPKSIT